MTAAQRTEATPPEPELGGLLARPWYRVGNKILNRHGRMLLIVCGDTDAEDDRIAAIVLGAVNPPLSGKEVRGG